MDQFEPYFAAAFEDGNIKRYIEPFVGGGAVFFHLSNKDRLPEKSFLYDNNEELRILYTSILHLDENEISYLTRKDPRKILEEVKQKKNEGGSA